MCVINPNTLPRCWKPTGTSAARIMTYVQLLSMGTGWLLRLQSYKDRLCVGVEKTNPHDGTGMHFHVNDYSNLLEC